MRLKYQLAWLIPVITTLSLSCSSPNTGAEPSIIIPGSGAPIVSGLFITTRFGPEVIDIWRSPDGNFSPLPSASMAKNRSRNTSTEVPKNYFLYVPYPNPFSDSLTVTYTLPQETNVSAWIVRARWVGDASSGTGPVGGGLVVTPGASPIRTLVPGSVQDPGYISAVWDGNDDTGEPVPDGFYRVYVSINNTLLWHDVMRYRSLDDLPSDLRAMVERARNAGGG